MPTHTIRSRATGQALESHDSHDSASRAYWLLVAHEARNGRTKLLYALHAAGDSYATDPAPYAQMRDTLPAWAHAALDGRV